MLIIIYILSFMHLSLLCTYLFYAPYFYAPIFYAHIFYATIFYAHVFYATIFYAPIFYAPVFYVLSFMRLSFMSYLLCLIQTCESLITMSHKLHCKTIFNFLKRKKILQILSKIVLLISLCNVKNLLSRTSDRLVKVNST